MSEHVRVYTDGGARGNPGPAGAGAVVRAIHQDGSEGDILQTVHEYLGETTNNQAEYMAIIRGLEAAKFLGAKKVEMVMDSELAVKQLNGQYRVKNAGLIDRVMDVRKLVVQFDQVTFRHVRRERNKEADAMVNAAIDEALKR